VSIIVSIVEGHGEVRALPILLRRLAQAHGIHDLAVPEPIRMRKDRFLRRSEEFSRMLALAAAKAGPGGGILIVVDADDDCPVELAADIARRADVQLDGRSVGVVVANREYEAWLIAGADSLASRRNLDADLAAPNDPEAIRDAKGWLSQRMGQNRYHEVVDQPALTAVFDIPAAVTTSRSLRKLIATVDRMLGVCSPGK
jgi:hypothetical protein